MTKKNNTKITIWLLPSLWKNGTFRFISYFAAQKLQPLKLSFKREYFIKEAHTLVQDIQLLGSNYELDHLALQLCCHHVQFFHHTLPALKPIVPLHHACPWSPCSVQPLFSAVPNYARGPAVNVLMHSSLLPCLVSLLLSTTLQPHPTIPQKHTLPRLASFLQRTSLWLTPHHPVTLGPVHSVLRCCCRCALHPSILTQRRACPHYNPPSSWSALFSVEEESRSRWAACSKTKGKITAHCHGPRARRVYHIFIVVTESTYHTLLLSWLLDWNEL